MDEWTIKPLKGFGLLEFGMTPDKVGQLNHIYGDLKSTIDEEKHAISITDFLINDPTITDEIRESIEILRSQTKSLKTEQRDLWSPTLSYMDDKLIFISVGNHTKHAIFETINIFEENPRDILVHLEKSNGGAKFSNPTVFFDKKGMALHEFYFTDHLGTPQFFDPEANEQDDRAIRLYPIGGMDDEMEDCTSVSFATA
jgi:hypothetical protein